MDEHESTQMPFRYMANDNGYPIMPKVRNCIAMPFSVELSRQNLFYLRDTSANEV